MPQSIWLQQRGLGERLRKMMAILNIEEEKWLGTGIGWNGEWGRGVVKGDFPI